MKNSISFVTKQSENTNIGHKFLLQRKNKITLNISLNKPETRQRNAKFPLFLMTKKTNRIEAYFSWMFCDLSCFAFFLGEKWVSEHKR